jgi:hypothetical protein
VAETHEVTISVLGASRAGKSTYLLGLYATMTRGIDHCTLHELDNNADVTLTEAWHDLGRGQLPRPTEMAPVRHNFVFARETRAKAIIHWTDFRGGALQDFVGPDGAPDVSDLLHQVSLSHGIFVMLDGEHFLKPITPARRELVAHEMLIHRISTVLTETFTRRTTLNQPLPSVAILVTKADLIDWHGAGTARTLAEVTNEIRYLLPVAFQPRVCTAVCPVSVGRLEPMTGGQIRPDGISPNSVHLPLLFSLARFYRTEAQAQNARLHSLGSRRAAANHELALLPPSGRRAVRLRREQLQRDLSAIADEEAANKRRLKDCIAEAAALTPLLRHLQVFEGGGRAPRAGGPHG